MKMLELEHLAKTCCMTAATVTFVAYHVRFLVKGMHRHWTIHRSCSYVELCKEQTHVASCFFVAPRSVVYAHM